MTSTTWSSRVTPTSSIVTSDVYTEGLRSFSVAFSATCSLAPNNMNVYIVTVKYPYCDHECIEVFDSMDAVMHKLEIMRLHGVDEDEEINIKCEEIVTEEKALERLNNVRKYKENN